MPSAVTSTSPSAAAAAGEPPAGAPSVHASNRPCQGSGGAAAMLSSPAAGCSNATAASSPGPSSIERTCSSPPGYVRLTTYCPGSSSIRSPGSRYPRRFSFQSRTTARGDASGSAAESVSALTCRPPPGGRAGGSAR